VVHLPPLYAALANKHAMDDVSHLVKNNALVVQFAAGVSEYAMDNVSHPVNSNV